jgi:hypothetical protein
MSFRASFHIVSIILLVMVVPLFWMVKESQEVKKLEEEVSHSSKWAKVKEITYLVVTECKNNAKYPVCLFAYMVHSPIIPLFSMTGILWIASFIDEGKVENDLEAKKIYKHASIIAMISALILLPVISQLSDKVSPLFMLPLSFLLRSLVAGSF